MRRIMEKYHKSGRTPKSPGIRLEMRPPNTHPPRETAWEADCVAGNPHFGYNYGPSGLTKLGVFINLGCLIFFHQ